MTSSNLNLVLLGKTGTGKSTLFNSLLGKQLAKVGDDLSSETKLMGVFTVNDVDVTIWDTPGLKDKDCDSKSTLKMISSICEKQGVDIFIYCTRFDEKRLFKDDVDCIRDISGAFTGIWDKAVFALTFADKYDTNPSKFEDRLEMWRKEFCEYVKKNAAGVQVDSIPFVPTTYDTKLLHVLPGNRAWLCDFWCACAKRMNMPALSAMTRVVNELVDDHAERARIAGVIQERVDELQTPNEVQASQKNESTIQDGGTAATPNDSGKSESTESTDDSNGAQGFVSFVGKKLKEYLDNLDKEGVGGCMLDIKGDLETYVGKELEGKNVQTTMEEIKFDISEAEITSTSVEDNPYGKKVIGKKKLTNRGGSTTVKFGPVVVKKTDATEEWKEKTRGWSFSPTLGVSHYGNASCTFTYSRGVTEKSVVQKASEISETHEENIPLEVGSSIMAAVEVKTKLYIINVKKLLLEFPSNTKLKVNRWPWSKEKLSNILVIRDEKDGKIIAESEGTVQIMEVISSVETYPVNK